MTLEEKGPIVPPPVLNKFPQMVSNEIQRWKEITAATHWEINDNTAPNGADFYVGQEELGHIHLDGEIHLPMEKELTKSLLKHKLAMRFMYADNWISRPVKSSDDAAHATWLFKLNYNRITGIPIEKLLAEVDNYAQRKM